ncbi:MAG: hypothetical protein ACQ9MH_26905, partial [Nitrospinales bacterium]
YKGHPFKQKNVGMGWHSRKGVETHCYGRYGTPNFHTFGVRSQGSEFLATAAWMTPYNYR